MKNKEARQEYRAKWYQQQKEKEKGNVRCEICNTELANYAL